MFEQRASGPLCHFCFGGGIRRLLYWESGFTPIVHTRSQPFCSAPVVGFHLSFDIFRIKGDNLQEIMVRRGILFRSVTVTKEKGEIFTSHTVGAPNLKSYAHQFNQNKNFKASTQKRLIW